MSTALSLSLIFALLASRPNAPSLSIPVFAYLRQRVCVCVCVCVCVRARALVCACCVLRISTQACSAATGMDTHANRTPPTHAPTYPPTHVYTIATAQAHERKYSRPRPVANAEQEADDAIPRATPDEVVQRLLAELCRVRRPVSWRKAHTRRRLRARACTHITTPTSVQAHSRV